VDQSEVENLTLDSPAAAGNSGPGSHFAAGQLRPQTVDWTKLGDRKLVEVVAAVVELENRALQDSGGNPRNDSISRAVGFQHIREDEVAGTF